jgi:hypothetical protein
MYRNHYSFSMPKPYTSLNLPQKFPEDIECIIKGKSSTQGSLYISNIEAAENLKTLKSTLSLRENSKSEQCSPVQKAMNCITRRAKFPFTSTSRPSIMKAAIYLFTSTKQLTSLRMLSLRPMYFISDLDPGPLHRRSQPISQHDYCLPHSLARNDLRPGLQVCQIPQKNCKTFIDSDTPQRWIHNSPQEILTKS